MVRPSLCDGLGKVPEVVEHVAVPEIDFDDHRFDAGLLVLRRLLHKVDEATDRDRVDAARALDREHVLDALFRNERVEPSCKGYRPPLTSQRAERATWNSGRAVRRSRRPPRREYCEREPCRRYL